MNVIGYTQDNQLIVTMSREEYRLITNPNADNDIRFLKFARKARGMTLAEVGEAVGISVSFLSDVERGRTNPSLTTYTKLIEFYNATPEATP